MKKILSVFTAAVVASSVFLTGCNETKSDGANYTFDYAMPGNPESLDPQYASDENSMTVIGNLFLGLMTMDDSGVLSNGVADSYTVSDDGLTYTFQLKKDCYWFFDDNENEEVDDGEYYPVTAHDFVFAFQRIFNPETCSPHKESFLCLKNAEGIVKGEQDYQEIGVRAASDTELVFELDYANAGFLNSLASTAAMPCNEDFFNSTKGRYGLDDKSVMSNGAFFVRQWFYDPYGHDNFVYMQRNLANDKHDKIYPSFLNFYIKDSRQESEASFWDGESDVLLTFMNDKKNTKENIVKQYDNYTLGIIVNPEDSGYSNKNIRKALAYGIDKAGFEGNLSEDLKPAYGVIPPGVSFLNKSYRELNSEKTASVTADGTSIDYNPELAVSYYEEGMSIMDKKSLDNIKILVPENLMDTEYLHLVTQNWQTLFGFYIGIEEVPEDEYAQRIKDNDYTMAIYPLTGDYNSPSAILEKFKSGYNDLGYSNTELDNIIKELKSLDNYNNSVETYLKAEQIILNDFYFIPVFYKTEYEIMGVGNDDIFFDPFTKQLFFRHAKYYE
ncbi:peptide ABC transporter substrate-binding protein [Porcipelethomonas sp.]|uniref:peptide ABC transporter substrate-binding protein n=1 Tax=Porcipelethomonas sp. TaxID=2981675 RepID=UPI003EFA618A